MRKGFKDDADFFKSHDIHSNRVVSRGEETLVKAGSHKYVRRIGTKGHYRYYYRNPLTGEIVEGDKSGPPPGYKMPKKKKMSKEQRKASVEKNVSGLVGRDLTDYGEGIGLRRASGESDSGFKKRLLSFASAEIYSGKKLGQEWGANEAGT